MSPLPSTTLRCLLGGPSLLVAGLVASLWLREPESAGAVFAAGFLLSAYGLHRLGRGGAEAAPRAAQD